MRRAGILAIEGNALLGKRFLVQLDGRGIDGAKLLHERAGNIAMATLSPLE
jgi:hypothetical protein